MGGAPVEGFGGWLLVLAALQWLAALGLLAELMQYLVQAASGGETMRAAALGGRLAVLALAAWAVVAMMRKRRLFATLLHVELVLLVVLWTWGIMATGTNFVTEPKAWLAGVARFGLSASVAAVGFAYAAASTRFRNTFVN